jgi:hypothetical protein
MYGHEIRDRCHVNFEANNLTFYARLLCAHLYIIYSLSCIFFFFFPRRRLYGIFIARLAAAAAVYYYIHLLAPFLIRRDAYFFPYHVRSFVDNQCPVV